MRFESCGEGLVGGDGDVEQECGGRDRAGGVG